MIVIVFTLPGSEIDTLELDAAITEQHSADAEVTQFPVEAGPSVSDHVRVLPERLRIEGVVSNTPLPSAPGVGAARYRDYAREVGEAQRGGQFGSVENPFSQRAETAYFRLKAIHGAGVPITVSTALQDYPDMILKSLDVPRAGDLGDAVHFSAEFWKVVQVQTETVALERSPKPGKRQRGKKPTEKLDEKTADRPDSGARAGAKAVGYQPR